MADYTGTSIVDYLKSTGQSSDFASRSKLASEKGISGYKGTAAQNTQLLNMLRGAGAPAPTPTPTPTPTIPTATAQPAIGEPKSAADLVKMGFHGYAGWPDVEALANYRETGGSGKGSAINQTLNAYQANLFKAETAPEVKVPTMEELKTDLAPTTALPEPLKRVEKFEELRTEYGLTELETTLTDLKAEQDELYALLRVERFTEEGKPVPMGVIAGRISEEERVYLERADYLGRQVARITDELNTKYAVVNNYMTLMGLDYQDAVTRYDDEFKRNIQMYNLIAGARKEARSAFESDRDAARSNLQIYMNAVTAGNLDYGSMSADQKLLVNKLETQAGLPVGFMSQVKMDPDANILFTTSNEGVTQVGMRNADGTISVQSYGTRITSGAGAGTAASTRQNFISDAKTIKGRNINGVWVGEFPLLVQRYAPMMSLEEIYRTYMSSALGQQYGAPAEDPSDIRMIYDRAKGEY